VPLVDYDFGALPAFQYSGSMDWRNAIATAACYLLNAGCYAPSSYVWLKSVKMTTQRPQLLTLRRLLLLKTCT
jgi:hypothetical protein